VIITTREREREGEGDMEIANEISIQVSKETYLTEKKK
jgi:hypothetical protein